MNNPNIQRVGNTVFNLLMVDDWLLALFRTNQDVWHFLEYLGVQLATGEPVPKEIHVFTIATTGIDEIAILETAKIVRMPLKVLDHDKPQLRYIYTAIHEDAEVERLKEIVRVSWLEIMEVLYG